MCDPLKGLTQYLLFPIFSLYELDAPTNFTHFTVCAAPLWPKAEAVERKAENSPLIHFSQQVRAWGLKKTNLHPRATVKGLWQLIKTQEPLTNLTFC